MAPALHKDRVPAERIVPLLREYIAKHTPPEDAEEDVAGTDKKKNRKKTLLPETALAHQAGVAGRHVRRLLNEEQQYLRFDTADRLICAMGIPFVWRLPRREGGLVDIYLSIEFEGEARVPTNRCARGGCSNTFDPSPTGYRGVAGGKRRLYCSPACQSAQSKREGSGHRTLGGKRYDTCPQGHDRSPENTIEYVKKSGPKAGYVERKCRLCALEKQREYRARKKVAA